MEKGQGKGTDTLATDNVFTRKEYIEREAALWFMNEVEPRICHNSDGVVFTATKDKDMLEYLRSIPAADVVPVVRCKNCRHRDPEDHKCDSGQLERAGCVFPVDDNYFCAYGERPNCGALMDKDGDGE